MSPRMQPPTHAPAGSTPPSADDKLARILSILESSRRRGRVEIAVAIVLSFATLCSTWCGYQASVWGGINAARASDADTNERKAAENTIVALQIRTMDGLRVLELWRSLRAGDARDAKILESHFPPRLEVAIRASLDAGALTDPNAPGPLEVPQYVIEEETLAAQQRTAATSLRADAGTAARRADQYVLLTLMFASVLFFGGIAASFTGKGPRRALAGMALALFVVSVAFMLSLPVGINRPTPVQSS